MTLFERHQENVRRRFGDDATLERDHGWRITFTFDGRRMAVHDLTFNRAFNAALAKHADAERSRLMSYRDKVWDVLYVRAFPKRVTWSYAERTAIEECMAECLASAFDVDRASDAVIERFGYSNKTP